MHVSRLTPYTRQLGVGPSSASNIKSGPVYGSAGAMCAITEYYPTLRLILRLLPVCRIAALLMRSTEHLSDVHCCAPFDGHLLAHFPDPPWDLSYQRRPEAELGRPVSVDYS